MYGTIKKIVRDKGFGFIVPDDGSGDGSLPPDGSVPPDGSTPPGSSPPDGSVPPTDGTVN